MKRKNKKRNTGQRDTKRESCDPQKGTPFRAVLPKADAGSIQNKNKQKQTKSNFRVPHQAWYELTW